jgi:hypothetical protein
MNEYVRFISTIFNQKLLHNSVYHNIAMFINHDIFLAFACDFQLLTINHRLI